MRGTITALLGTSLVMYVANGISIEAGKGNNVPCVVVGVGTLGAGLALWGKVIVDKVRR